MAKIIGFGGGLPFFFCIILCELLVLKYVKKKPFSLPLALTNLQIGIGFFLFKLLFFGFYYYAYLFVYHLYHFFDFSSIYVDFALAFILYDLGFYWGHRFGHEVNFFWGGHVTHHQSEEYNLSVAYRLTWIGGPLVYFAFLPVALIGVSPKCFFLAASINSIYQFFMHTSLVKRYPSFLEWIFVSPLFHSTHHGKNEHYIDKNYGSFFTIWDRMFGTYASTDIVPVFGLPKAFKGYDPVKANFYYFGEIFANVFRMRPLNRLKLLFGKPSFHESSLKTDEDKTDIKRPISSLFYYAVFQTVFIMIVTSIYVHYFSEIKHIYTFLYLIWFTYSLSHLGRMMEGRRFPVIWEMLRLLVFLCTIFPLVGMVACSDTTLLYLGGFAFLFSLIHYLFIIKASVKVAWVRYVS
ncbi:MAG: sterol desaturase family protein [Chitinophagales bacterium]|nr:sterol desaturase family protein [Chitinophagales bacterium]